MSGRIVASNSVTSTAPENAAARFAAVIPLGPSAIELWRGILLVTDLMRFEPAIGWCVFVDDSDNPRDVSHLPNIRKECQAVTLLNPRRGAGNGWSGGLTLGVLEAAAWVQANTCADFVLKVDTDAMVIAPFSHAVRAFIAGRPDAGVIGALGLSCNPTIRAQQSLISESKLLRAHRLLPSASAVPRAASEDERIQVAGVGRLSLRQLRAFDKVRSHVQTAADHGYTTSEFCQGGAYVLTRTMLDRMASAGYLADRSCWTELPFCDDRVSAMYARAVGLAVCDYSGPGEPFGINYVGLAYCLEELRDRDHCVIHSVKNDRSVSEAQIRAFFLSAR